MGMGLKIRGERNGRKTVLAVSANLVKLINDVINQEEKPMEKSESSLVASLLLFCLVENNVFRVARTAVVVYCS